MINKRPDPRIAAWCQWFYNRTRGTGRPSGKGGAASGAQGYLVWSPTSAPRHARNRLRLPWGPVPERNGRAFTLFYRATSPNHRRPPMPTTGRHHSPGFPPPPAPEQGLPPLPQTPAAEPRKSSLATGRHPSGCHRRLPADRTPGSPPRLTTRRPWTTPSNCTPRVPEGGPGGLDRKSQPVLTPTLSLDPPVVCGDVGG